MSKVKLISVLLMVVAAVWLLWSVLLMVVAAVWLLWPRVKNITSNEINHTNTQQVCQIPNQTAIDGFRFNPITCNWEVVTNTPNPTPTTESSHQSATTTQATYVIFPATVWRNGTAVHDPNYDVLFDPFQGGSSDHPPYGWYWQPNLPTPPKREAHEVAITLRAPSRYRFIGPECQVFWNWDGNHPFQNGKLIVDRQNGEVYITPTTGNEAWIFVRCPASWASGFSFEALQTLP